MVREACEAGADIIMLDNMSDDQIRQAVEIIGGRRRPSVPEMSPGKTSFGWLLSGWIISPAAR